ncbi:helix-turn-helix domain-containing protein [Membranihabitans maritimus]|uniref:helix-turn-helix domain-containing protein n=1 Tax=Membranihabitans maritimus TaxID=2904244 RepID=UPI001F22BE45|nr:helix-turn-helix transcriptional regulator [Membranihabitans maritimus]
MDILKNIRHIREIRLLTQEVMASEMGISQSAYNKIETGQTQLTQVKLKKIAEIFEVEVDTLIKFDPEVQLSPPKKSCPPNQEAFSPDLREVYEKQLKEKDKKIIILLQQVKFLQNIIDRLKTNNSD